MDDDTRGLDLVDLEPGDARLVPEVLPVLRELRPHLTAESFTAVYEEGHPQGLRFLAAYDGERCVGVAGWRMIACTSLLRRLYVDDLVTSEAARSGGVGRVLLAELERRAADGGSGWLTLDSGVTRFEAHRFYFRERMAATAHHFTKPVEPVAL
jgi:GNAT superfamily N-acetyltransferase